MEGLILRSITEYDSDGILSIRLSGTIVRIAPRHNRIMSCCPVLIEKQLCLKRYNLF